MVFPCLSSGDFSGDLIHRAQDSLLDPVLVLADRAEKPGRALLLHPPLLVAENGVAPAPPRPQLAVEVFGQALAVLRVDLARVDVDPDAGACRPRIDCARDPAAQPGGAPRLAEAAAG